MIKNGIALYRRNDWYKTILVKKVMRGEGAKNFHANSLKGLESIRDIKLIKDICNNILIYIPLFDVFY